MNQKQSLRFSRKDPRQFYATMRKRVNAYFEENHIAKTGGWRMYVKSFFMLSLYFAPFVLILTLGLPAWTELLLYAVMGLGLSGVGLSIMHDANHGSYSRHDWVNRLMGYTLNVVGGSSFTWKVQHNVLHHTYTNVYELDEDIHDKPFLRLSPYGKYKPYHRFQHLYAVPLYSLATISWVLNKDFGQLRRYNQTGMTQQIGHDPKTEWGIMLLTKAIYIGYMIVLPMLLGVTWWVVLLGFVVMHIVSGIFITTIFQLAHVVEGPDHHIPDPSGTMDDTWAIHQLKTTANFARYNRPLGWFIGGLNHQVEHHLFPNICHIHYYKISSIVKETALEYGFPYHENKYFLGALGSHLRVLKEFGISPTVARPQQHGA